MQMIFFFGCTYIVNKRRMIVPFNKCALALDRIQLMASAFSCGDLMSRLLMHLIFTVIIAKFIFWLIKQLRENKEINQTVRK